MLSAFTARPIIELRQRDKSKIETILAYGDRVFVGLNTGSLRTYRLNDLPPPAAPPKPANGSSPEPGAPSGNGASDDASTAPEPSQPPAAAAAPGAAPPAGRPAARPTDLLRETEKFAPRAIEQLAVIKEANTLVSLSGSAVHLHDLQTLEPLGEGYAPLPRTRGASCFAVTSNIVRDPEAGDIPEIISRLAVAVKRRLLLWSWRESELAEEVAEVVLAESVRSVTWASATKVVCGMNAGYVVVDVLTRAAEEVNAPGPAGGTGGRFGAMSSTGMSYMGLGGYMPRPLAAKLSDGQVLLAKDTNTLFITDDGRPLDKRQIPWQSAPESVGYSYPYILALQPPARGSLEVRNPDTLSLLQTIALPGAAQLHFPPPGVSLAHAGKGFHISSERAVWKMDATDYDAQVGELVAGGRLDEAISVLGMLEDALLRDKAGTLREVKMHKAELLFRQRRYRESMDLFNEEEVHAPPERVLRLFPRLIAGALAECDEDGDKDKDKDSGESDESDEGGGANGKAAANGGKGGPRADAAPAEAAAAAAASPPKTATGGFTKMFLGHRRINSETASIASSRRADADDAASIAGKGADEGPRPLEGKDLMSAVLELRGFLAGTRQRLQRVLDPVTGKLKQPGAQGGSPEAAFRSILTTAAADAPEEALERELRATFRLVDTALFRAYMFSAPTLASSLFRIPNFCDPDVVNERLLETSRYNELVDFFYGKRLHRQALELLRTFGAGERPDAAAPSLHGPQRTVAYLQNLPPDMIDLILEFSAWALRADPDLAMEVFVADTENAETLPRDRVAAFLGGVDAGLEVRYLEHLTAELNDTTPDFHNRLAELYIEHLRGRAPRDEGWRAEMGRLVAFLKESRQYGMRKAFELLPKDDPDFYEAEAVVLSAMGQDKQALEIYVFKMQDYAKAEEYCNRVHKAQGASRPASPARPRTSGPSDDGDGDGDGDGGGDGGDAAPSIYHTLLSLYLTPPPPHAPNLGPALDLLSRHGSRLPAASTLSLIPDAMPVAELESYFRGRMRAANSAVNAARVAAGLRKAELVASQALLLLGDGGPGGQGGRSRRVVVGDERVCGACHKRLGGSVVAVLPDNAVVHYGCLGRATGQQHGRAEGRAPSWGRSSAY